MPHEQRLSVSEVDPKAYQAIFSLEKYVRNGSLDEGLLSLVKTRASQLNGCAFCLDMHAQEARAAGVTQRQLDVLAAWPEAPDLFTERQRAALSLAESVTQIGQAGVPNTVWDTVAASFGQEEIVQLLMAICAINVWNRLAVSTHQALPEQSETGSAGATG